MHADCTPIAPGLHADQKCVNPDQSKESFRAGILSLDIEGVDAEAVDAWFEEEHARQGTPTPPRVALSEAFRYAREGLPAVVTRDEKIKSHISALRRAAKEQQDELRVRASRSAEAARVTEIGPTTAHLIHSPSDSQRI